MDMEIAIQNIYQAYLTLIISHSIVPETERKLRDLETRMRGIMNEYEELVQ